VLGESAVDPGDPGDPVVAARAEMAKTGASSLGLLLAPAWRCSSPAPLLIGIGRAREVLGERRRTGRAALGAGPGQRRRQEARTAWAAASRAIGMRKGEHDT
jgi:hypothetical protein